MAVYSVVKSGGKQYLVKAGETIIAERVAVEATKNTDMEVLMTFNEETGDVKVGAPFLDEKMTGQVLEHLKGDKIRIAKFKSKVRYRKLRGFRSSLSKIQVA